MLLRLRLFLTTRLTRQGRQVHREVREADERWAEQLAAAVALAVDEARSATPPGRRPRVDVDDVLDVLARPTFDDVVPSPAVVAGELRDLVERLDDDQALDTDAFDPVHNPFRPLLRGRAPAPDDTIEVRLTGPEETVQQLVEDLVEMTGPATATPVSYRPARDGAAVRARFRIIPAEADE